MYFIISKIQFHRDVPRLFIEPQTTIINKYLDKRRKLDYYRIVRIIEEENKLNPSRPPKGIVGISKLIKIYKLNKPMNI